MIQGIRQSITLISPQITGDSDRIICQYLESIARVCYDSGDKMTEDSYKSMMNVLLEKQHYGIFENILATFDITSSRAIANEFTRHRMMSFAQQSTRYIKLDKRTQYIINDKLDNISGLSIGSIENSINSYRKAILLGARPEDARDLLPLCLATRFVATANLSSWMHFLTLRTHKAAHHQMRELAIMIFETMIELIPTIFTHKNALNKL